jgi:hypothetical protein
MPVGAPLKLKKPRKTKYLFHNILDVKATVAAKKFAESKQELIYLKRGQMRLRFRKAEN